ncbi:hypothetical protein Tco_0951485, partial [Tanacetum coccineum]
MGTPTQVCVWSCPNFSAPAGRPFRCVSDIWLLISGDAKVGRGGRGRIPREGNDECVDDLNGHGNDQGMGANGGIEGVNGNVEGANRGAPDFSTIIAQQLQNLLPAMLAQVSNQRNVGNQNGNVVNENVQENVGNVIVNGNRVGCSYKDFLACNPKEYDGDGYSLKDKNEAKTNKTEHENGKSVKRSVWMHPSCGSGALGEPERKGEGNVNPREGYVFEDVKCTDVARLGKIRLELEEIVKFLTQRKITVVSVSIMPKGYNFPRGNCIHCVGVGTNVEEEFDVADLLNVAAKTLRNGKFGSGYKAGLIVLLLKLMSRLLALHLYIRNVRNKNAQER